MAASTRIRSDSSGTSGGEHRTVRPDLVAEHLRGTRLDIATQGLDEGLVRDQSVLVTAADEQETAVGADDRAQLGGEARLADARFAGERDHAALARAHARPFIGQRAHLVRTSHERAACPRADDHRSGIQGHRRAALGPDLLDELARGCGRHDVQFAGEPVAEAVVRRQSGSTVPCRRQPPQQGALRRLGERIERDQPTGQTERGLRVSVDLRRLRGGAQSVRHATAQLVASREDPVVVQPGQELRRGPVERGLGLSHRDELVDLVDVGDDVLL